MGNGCNQEPGCQPASALVDEDLAGFPILIRIIDSDLNDNAQPDGDDIVFTDMSGIKLNHEIEKYESGELVSWVNIPILSPFMNSLISLH